MRNIFCLVGFLIFTLVTTPVVSGQESEIVVSGALYCSLKRAVIMPFHGIIDSVEVSCGQEVKKGDVLARYILEPETELELRRKISSFHIRDLEMELARIRNRLTELEAEQSDLRELRKSKMASEDSLKRIEREIELLKKNRSIIEQRLPVERSLAAAERRVIGKKLGAKVSQGRIASKASLVSPIDGHIVWISPEVRAGGEPRPHKRAFMVGIMDPMTVLTRVYEKEVLDLEVGDIAELTVDSIPDRTFEAKVTYISWSPQSDRLYQPTYYDVRLEVKNKDLVLREGFKGKVAFQKKH